MPNTQTLRAIEGELEKRGYSNETRAAIRNARICIVDDYIEDLKGLTQSLRSEGFTNLIELSKVGSVDELLTRKIELLILDLTGVAGEISADDGFGVLEHIKNANPALPVLVVTGTTTPPEKVPILSRADLIRSKPVKALELVSDVEQLLRHFKDQYWAALEVLKGMKQIDADLRSELSAHKRLILWWRRRQLEKHLTKQSGSTVADLISIGKIVSGLGTAAIKIVEIVKKFSEVTP